jgi:hypothetical protein
MLGPAEPVVDAVSPSPPAARLARVIAHPAFPQIRLWTDAASCTGVDLHGRSRVRPGLEKYAVPADAQFAARSAPLRLVYALTNQNRPDITFEPLALRQVFRLLVYRTAGVTFLGGLGLRASHFDLVTALAPCVSAVRIRRPTAGASVRDLADAVEADIERRLCGANCRDQGA